MHTPTTQQHTSSVLQFLDDLIDQKFITQQTAITPKVREAIKQDLIIRLDDFVAARIIATLSNEDLTQFEKLLNEGKTQEEIQQFAAQRIADFDTFITEAFLEFRSVYLGT